MRRFCRAFTLVELLVVIGIIGILTALLLPVFLRARGSARSITCVSNLRQIGMAMQMYQADYGKMPRNNFVDAENFKEWKGHDPLEPYTHNGAIYHCPESDPKLAGSYEYRASLSLSQPESGGPVIDDAKLVVLAPMSVLAFCWQHAQTTRDHHFEGAFSFVRADGSAKRVPAGQVVPWVYEYKTSRWLKPPESYTASGRWFPVFAEEPWPPEFEQ